MSLRKNIRHELPGVSPLSQGLVLGLVGVALGLYAWVWIGANKDKLNELHERATNPQDYPQLRSVGGREQPQYDKAQPPQPSSAPPRPAMTVYAT